MALIPGFFLDCVVALGSLDRDPTKTDWVGSGFLLGDHRTTLPDGQKQYGCYLVTNRHVLQGIRNLQLRFNPESSAPARQFSVVFADDVRWFGHPDTAVDVAVVPLDFNQLVAEGIRFSFFVSDEHTLTMAAAGAAGMSEGDGVFVLGFPMGLVGERRNYAIVRQGCLARVRDTLAGDAREFLVDATVFPGNSGGPVVTRPDVVSIEGTEAPRGANLLGVVRGYKPYEEVAVSVQTGQPRVVFVENSGLAAVVPYDRVAETVAEATRLVESQATRKAPVTEVDASTGESATEGD